VLEFDGVNGRLIRTDRQTRARALARCDDGRLYVGAQGEFGYLANRGPPNLAARANLASSPPR
jgi:hypothetical protein